MKRISVFVCALIAIASFAISKEVDAASVSISGELRQWHTVTLTVDGPEASEEGAPNPFLDYRMEVAFMNADSGVSYIVPGYFAADGNAANTSATSGNKWRAHVCPDHEGEWTYSISFRQGPSVAISDDADEGTPVESVDGLEGTITIAATDKSGRDFRGKGRLNYVGKHHLQFAGTGEFFLKAGADAPENFLAYSGFDGDFKTDGHKDNLIKDWQPHVQDWKPGDPTWQGDKGKGIIGAINYLASQGLNAFSFLTLNIEGDDQNVYPYTTYDERSRIDCSRMDQWEMVLAHGDKMGMYLHFKTQEAENVNLLDGGETGPQRKLYYRELIARFSHHLAMNWNLGEEVGLGHKVSTEKKVAWAKYFWDHDPYQHHIVIHNGNRHYDMLGNASKLTGFSLQTNKPDFRNVHGETLGYLRRSVQAGKPWVVACDEPGDAQHSLVPDEEDPTRDNARQNALWGNIMAGGAGVEWYFGYKHAHSDLTCQDYRVREKMWQQCRIALEFFANEKIPFQNMTNANDLLGTKNGYCLAESGKQYLVYLKQADTTTLDLHGADRVFEILWFNPRTGGDLQVGSTQAVNGGGKVNLGQPPMDSDQDWLAILRPARPNAEYPPGVGAGSNTSIMLPRSKNKVDVTLNGFVSAAPGAIIHDTGKLTAKWTKTAGPSKVTFADPSAANTSVTLNGVGEYVLTLSASDEKKTSESSVTITVEPFTAKVTRSLKAVEDACIDGTKVVNDRFLKIEGKRRTSIIKFDIKDLPPRILDAQLHLTVAGDAGSGTLKLFEGSHSHWNAASLKTDSAPKRNGLVERLNVNVGEGDVVKIPVKSVLKSDGLYTLIVTLDEGGDDIWFGSTVSDAGPKLEITFEDPDGTHASFGDPANASASQGTTAQGSSSNAMVLDALKDFQLAVNGKFVPGYKDQGQRALAINAAKHQNKFAAAESKYQGQAGTYDLVLTSLAETDGESSYRLLVSGKKVGEAKNPPTTKDYAPVRNRFKGIALKAGDIIRVEFNSASNGKIPEGDAFAFSRGRWRSVAVVKPNSTITQPVAATPFELTYDAANAKHVSQQTDGIVVVEAEDFDAVDRQDQRKWYVTRSEQTPGIKPDPDPNHAEGAVNGAYIEILPDTRVTHSDPLVNGVSFSNTPGECSVLHYPIEITEPGRYYVWVRMCCTGSEDNGLHVGIDGQWPESGARMQWTGKHGEWQWDSRQRTEKVHTGVLGKIWLDIDKPGLHTVMFSMREDGFEFDRFLLTKKPGFMASKNSEPGPVASPVR